MKKLPFVLCLMFLCIALFNSRVYAVFITNITEFEQENDPSTPATFFLDTFSSVLGAGGEPPDGPSGPSTYVVEGTFGSTRESGGKLVLDSDDGILDMGEMFLAAAVSDSTHFFTKGVGGHVIGTFDFSGGLPSGSFFGIEILNFASDGGGGIVGGPLNDDEAWMGVSRDDFTGHLIGVWGDETQEDPLGFVDLGVVGSTTIGLEFVIDSTDNVTALFNYGSGFSSATGYKTLSFFAGREYTGAFAAGESAIPEPTTIALLGIGLMGLGGGYLRKRIRKKKE